MPRSIVLALCAIWLPLHAAAFGQLSGIDSLQNQYSLAKDDSTRSHLLVGLANELYKSDRDSALSALRSALQLSDAEYSSSAYEVWTTKGKVFMHYFNYDSAKYSIGQALSIAEEQGNLRRTADCLIDMADADNRSGNKQRAIENLRLALDHAVSLNDEKLQFTILNRSGSYYSYLTEFDSSEAYYKQALSLQKGIGNRQHESGVWMNLGNNAARANDLTQALKYYGQAVTLKQELNDRVGEALVYRLMGYSCSIVGDLPLAISYYLKALDLYESENKNEGIISTCNALGQVYFTMQEYTLADSYADRVLKALNESDHHSNKSMALILKGEVYYEKGEYPKALLILNEAKRIIDRNQQEQPSQLITALGSCHEKLGRVDSAIFYLDSALVLSLSSNNHIQSSRILTSLGSIHYKEGSSTKAINELERAIGFAKLMGNLEYEMAATGKIYEVYKTEKDYETALSYYERHEVLQDSLFSTSSIKEIARIEAKNVFEKEKQQLEFNQSQKLQGQRFFRTILFIGLVLVIIVLLAVFRFYVLKKMANRELTVLNQELHEQKDLVEEQKSALVEMDEIKGRFFTNISHEFRTPLTLILGPTEQQQKKDVSSENYNYYSLVLNNGRRLLQLIDQILDLNKLEAGKLEGKFVQSDGAKLVHHLFNSLNSLGEAKGLNMTSPVDSEEVMMDLDKEMMTKVVHNLVSNAVKFTKDGGSIELELSRSNGHFQFSITDSGVGISNADLPHVFDRFYQSTETADDQVGSGVGLALTQELVRTLNGTINVESELGAGTRFLVALPITNKAALIELEIRKPELYVTNGSNEKEPAAIDIDGNAPIALVVEDNKDMALHVADCLQPQYQVVLAENGRIGIEKAIEIIPDIIISDVMMPEKDGFALTEELKQDERTSHIPIVLLTARADIEDRISGLKSGADDYLAKPFNAEELQLRTKNLLALRDKFIDRYAQGVPEKVDGSLEMEIEDAFLIKVKESLHVRLDDSEFGANEITRSIGMGRTQFYRKIKALTGESPSNYIRNLRLLASIQLLKGEDVRISEVAYAVGFSDPQYFSRSFAKYFGQAPTEYKG